MLDPKPINVSNNLAETKQRIRECEVLFARKPDSVSLLAVSKGQPIEKIAEAIAAGQCAFGENYLQEALPKLVSFAEKNIEWHFIGLIQHNKIKKIAEHFSWVHSITDKDIAKRLSEQRPVHLPPLNICLQVNASELPNKQGVSLAEVIDLAHYCATLPRLKLRGLMTIPELKETLTEQRVEFATLRTVFEELKKTIQLDTLSMGMSNDMKAAIAEGTTMVRVGTAIFGARE